MATTGCRLNANKAHTLLKGMRCKLRLEISKRPSTKVQIPTGLTQSFCLPKYINLIPSSFTVKGILRSRGPPPRWAEAEGSLSRCILGCCRSSPENRPAVLPQVQPSRGYLLILNMLLWETDIKLQKYKWLAVISQLGWLSSKYWLYTKPQSTFQDISPKMFLKNGMKSKIKISLLTNNLRILAC